VWAKYGQDVKKSNFDTLARVTFWSDQAINNQIINDTQSFAPDYVINTFEELVEIIPPKQRRLFP
ncbi:MAG: hypothetical protein ACREV3_07840, partial [Gammaproteobacteria bacterium]